MSFDKRMVLLEKSSLFEDNQRQHVGVVARSGKRVGRFAIEKIQGIPRERKANLALIFIVV